MQYNHRAQFFNLKPVVYKAATSL